MHEIYAYQCEENTTDPHVQFYLLEQLWWAPEVLRDSRFRRRESDIYSFGMILYEIFTRQYPYENEIDKERKSVKGQ